MQRSGQRDLALFQRLEKAPVMRGRQLPVIAYAFMEFLRKQLAQLD